jgi:hypothetical protein
MPEYTCEAVILPFIHAGYAVHFFEIEDDLSISVDKWKIKYNYIRPGIVLFHPYFGFDTIINIRDYYKEIQSNESIVIEDVTHSMLFDFPVDGNADYYVGSIRKWAGMPDGGVLADYSRKVKISLLDRCDDPFVNIRIKAFDQKNRFVSGDNSIEKESYLSLFEQAENYLDLDLVFEPKSMSEISLKIIGDTDWKFVRRKRRENYLFLEEQFKKFPHIFHPVFSSLPELVYPLFMPISVKNNRQKLKKWFVHHDIYTPSHWPISKYIPYKNPSLANKLYHEVLSIPCDQRYGREDMYRIIDVLDRYKIIS